MRDFKSMLDAKGVLVADGAWGTEMIGRGLAPGECPELWNLSRPDDVRAIAGAYKEAGADIILTNTFGANSFKLKKTGAADRVSEINRIGVELSREASGGSLVFASMGSTGEFLQPLGTISREQMILSFREQVNAFVEGGADGVIIETMTDLNEVKCAIAAVRENSDLTLAVSITFEKGAHGFATIMGVTPEQAARELKKEGVDVAGSNCGSGIENMVVIARAMHEVSALPLWIKPNAGVAQLKGGKTVYPESPEQMAKFVPELLNSGAKVIGGCCGTTPEHIRLIVKAIESYEISEFEGSRKL